MHFLQDIQEELIKEGFIVISLLQQEQIKHLLNVYETTVSTSGVNAAFYTSIWSDDINHRKNTDEGIKEVLFKELVTIIKDIQPVFANFMVKAPGDASALLPHQDWSFVDEPQFESYTVWVPLVDVNPKNGNLQVVPASHLKYKNYVRARFSDAPFDRDEEAKNLIDIPMKAGKALILNSRLIHASPPNLSGKERIAASIVIAPKAAILKHWVSRNDLISEMQVDESFFWKHSCYDKLSE